MEIEKLHKDYFCKFLKLSSADKTLSICRPVIMLSLPIIRDMVLIHGQVFVLQLMEFDWISFWFYCCYFKKKFHFLSWWIILNPCWLFCPHSSNHLKYPSHSLNNRGNEPKVEINKNHKSSPHTSSPHGVLE